jgi:hypothetical protein
MAAAPQQNPNKKLSVCSITRKAPQLGADHQDPRELVVGGQMSDIRLRPREPEIRIVAHAGAGVRFAQ